MLQARHRHTAFSTSAKLDGITTFGRNADWPRRRHYRVMVGLGPSDPAPAGSEASVSTYLTQSDSSGGQDAGAAHSPSVPWHGPFQSWHHDLPTSTGQPLESP